MLSEFVRAAIVFDAFYSTKLCVIGAVGERVVFGVSFLVFSPVFFVCAKTKEVLVAAGVIVLNSVPLIVSQMVRIVIMVQGNQDNLASNLGVLNLFCVV